MKKTPDIALDGVPAKTGRLAKAGMTQIEAILKVKTDLGVLQLPAKIDLHVNIIDPNSKGIHMSRLFLLLQKATQSDNVLAQSFVKELLQKSIHSHRDISDRAYVRIQFEYPIIHQSLISENQGTRLYPIEVYATMDSSGDFKLSTTLHIHYSSTCPCSAALARELIQNKFLDDFGSDNSIDKDVVLEWLGKEASIMATPHGQRSEASVKLFWNTNALTELDFKKWIIEIEQTLKTPVQAAVKREDEQEFARLNGGNLMFAEDSARLLQDRFKDYPGLEGIISTSTHFESLHAHNAQAIAKVGNCFEEI